MFGEALGHLEPSLLGFAALQAERLEIGGDIREVQLARAHAYRDPIRCTCQHGGVPEQLPVSEQQARTLQECQAKQVRPVQGDPERPRSPERAAADSRPSGGPSTRGTGFSRTGPPRRRRSEAAAFPRAPGPTRPSRDCCKAAYSCFLEVPLSMPTMTIGGMVPAAIRAECRLVQPQLLLALEGGAIVEGSLAVQHVQRRIHPIRWSIGVAWRQPDANGDLALVHHARECLDPQVTRDGRHARVLRLGAGSVRHEKHDDGHDQPQHTSTPYLPSAGTQAPDLLQVRLFTHNDVRAVRLTRTLGRKRSRSGPSRDRGFASTRRTKGGTNEGPSSARRVGHRARLLVDGDECRRLGSMA